MVRSVLVLFWLSEKPSSRSYPVSLLGAQPQEFPKVGVPPLTLVSAPVVASGPLFETFGSLSGPCVPCGDPPSSGPKVPLTGRCPSSKVGGAPFFSQPHSANRVVWYTALGRLSAALMVRAADPVPGLLLTPLWPPWRHYWPAYEPPWPDRVFSPV